MLCHCHWQPQRAGAMTVVIVHGLEGSSDSQYVIGTGSKAWAAGMNVVRMNMRNCGNTEHLGPTLYNSSMSADVGSIAKTLIAEDGLQKLAFIGYSMGGNLVLKLLGEWGAGAPPQVKAGVGVSPAVDLAPSADALHLPPIGCTSGNSCGDCGDACAARQHCFPSATMSGICVECEVCGTLTIRSPRVILAFAMPRIIIRVPLQRAWWMPSRFLLWSFIPSTIPSFVFCPQHA